MFILLFGAQMGHLSRFDICPNRKSSQNQLHPETRDLFDGFAHQKKSRPREGVSPSTPPAGKRVFFLLGYSSFFYRSTTVPNNFCIQKSIGVLPSPLVGEGIFQCERIAILEC